MAFLNVGDTAPQFTLSDHKGDNISLENFRGQWVVLYFYPKDNTKGCTAESCDFSAQYDEFQNLEGVIIGVSPDSPKSHTNFIKKYNLKHILLSDPQHEVLEKYGAWQMKKVCGKECMGVVRSTYLINPQGIIAYVWDKVKVDGHSQAVYEKLRELQSAGI